MKVNIQFTPHYFYVGLVGKFDSEVAQHNFSEILQRCKRDGLSNIIIDLTEIVGEILATDKVFTGMSGVDTYLKLFQPNEMELKIAVIGREQYLKRNSPPYTPGIEVLKNAGIKTMLTHDRSTAIKWIKGQTLDADFTC